jgi:hypothetical protein
MMIEKAIYWIRLLSRGVVQVLIGGWGIEVVVTEYIKKESKIRGGGEI